jgi:predicted PurR-regulated permease PerM
MLLLALALIVWLAYALRGLVTPILIGLVLAYLFEPVVARLERHRVPRAASVVILLLLLVTAAILLAGWLGPIITGQADALVSTLADRFEELLGNHAGTLSGGEGALTGGMLQRLVDEPIAVIHRLLRGTGRALGVLGSVLDVTTYAMLCAFLIPIAFLAFGLYLPRMVAWVDQWIPESRRQRVREIVCRMDIVLAGFFRSRLLIALIMTGGFALGWSPLVTDVPHWLLLALVTGLLCVLPYVAALGWLLALVLKLLEVSQLPDPGTWQWVSAVVGPTLVYGIVQFLEGWFLTPWMQGRSTDLSPLTVLVAVLVGGSLAGVGGLLLAIPFAACLKVLTSELVAPRARAWVRSH